MSWKRGVVITVLLGSITGVLMYGYLVQLDAPAAVVVAAHDLEAPHQLTAADLAVVQISARNAHPRSFSDAQALVGRHLLTSAVAGQTILEPHVTGPDDDGPLAARLGADSVAFFVPLSPGQALGGAVAEGDHVDLLLVAGRGSQGPVWSQTVVHGAPVLELRDDSGRGYDGSTGLLGGLLLRLRPEDAVRAAFALEQGRLYAALSGNSRGYPAGPVGWDNLFPLPGPAVPSPWRGNVDGEGAPAHE